MRAVTVPTPGGPEAMVIDEVATPSPGPGEVLVEVAYAGVNRPDVLQRMGVYPAPKGASPLLGLEVAGRVVARGEGSSLALGAEICALCNGGGYADYVAVPEGQALPVPAGLSLAEAAAIPETFFTVWLDVFELGRLQSGEALLVHGGTSGIGTTAIQLARAFGARAYATAGNEAKCEAARAIGAIALDYQREDFVEALRRHEDGVDVVLDMVGGDYVPKNLALLREGGRHVSIAFLRGKTATVDLMMIMQKGLLLTGSLLRPRSRDEKAAIAQALRREVWPKIETGEVRPVIDRVFALADVGACHDRMQKSEHVGKMVLEVRG